MSIVLLISTIFLLLSLNILAQEKKLNLVFNLQDSTERNGSSVAIFENNEFEQGVFKGALLGINSGQRKVGIVGTRKKDAIYENFTHSIVRMMPTNSASQELSLRLVFKTSAIAPLPLKGILHLKMLSCYKRSQY